MTHLESVLEANLRKYRLFLIFQKRAFLPAIGIYLVSVARLSYFDISTISSITLLVRLVLEIPTGKFADRFGRKLATMVGTFIATLSPLAYLIFPGYAGGLAGSLCYFGGWSFVSGAHNALLHDSMQALGRELEYARFRGRAQSYSLLGNMVIVALVPMSYQIDPRLPFLIGFFFLCVTFFIACSYFEAPHDRAKASTAPSVLAVLKSLPRLDSIVLFSVYGIVFSIFDNLQQFREILFSSLDVKSFLFGPILAVSSLFAAVAGHVVHHLTKIPQFLFYIFDIAVMILLLLLIGGSGNKYVVIVGFLLLSAYDRNRPIVAETFALSTVRAPTAKATLLSILNFFPPFHGVWVSLVLGTVLHHFGLQAGMQRFGITVGILLLIPILIFTGIARTFFRRTVGG